MREQATKVVTGRKRVNCELPTKLTFRDASLHASNEQKHRPVFNFFYAYEIDGPDMFLRLIAIRGNLFS